MKIKEHFWYKTPKVPEKMAQKVGAAPGLKGIAGYTPTSIACPMRPVHRLLVLYPEPWTSFIYDPSLLIFINIHRRVTTIRPTRSVPKKTLTITPIKFDLCHKKLWSVNLYLGTWESLYFFKPQ